jgi:hypothetical protein
MWALLKKTDIEQAKQELKLRRAETLRRQVEESRNLDADRVELETLNELVDVFVQKHPRPAIVSHAPISPPSAAQKPAIVSHAPISPPSATHNSGGQTSAEAKNQRRRHETVYASYMRAMSRV